MKKEMDLADWLIAGVVTLIFIFACVKIIL